MTSSQTNRPGMREKISYGFGDLASVLYWQTFMLYLPFFYTDVFRIPATVTATMFLLSRIFDGINDPLMGMIADRTKTRWGRFRPWILWLCVPFAVTGVLTFTTPDFGEQGKIIWAYITFFSLMILYTGISIPYTSLLGVISPNADDRTSLSSIKFTCAFAAGILVSATLLPMVKFLGAGNEAKGWQYAFIIYGIAAVIFFLITFRGTRERVLPPRSQKSSVKKDLSALFTNGPWWILFLATITFILFIAVRSSITIHYFKYYIGEQQLNIPFFPGTYGFETLVSVFNTVGQLSCLLGVILVAWFARKVGKKPAFLILLVVSILTTSLFYFLKPHQVVLIFSLQVICSMSGGPLSVLLWVMYADTADYSEWKANRRATGLIFSASSMSQKFGWAIATYLALQVMAQMGFQANEQQSAESLRSMHLLFSVIPAGIGVISLVIFSLYPLGDKRMATVAHDLETRRKNAAL